MDGIGACYKTIGSFYFKSSRCLEKPNLEWVFAEKRFKNDDANTPQIGFAGITRDGDHMAFSIDPLLEDLRS